MSYRPARGGCVLRIARFGRLGWYVKGDGWTMQPRPAGRRLTLADEKQICVAAAAAIRGGQDVDSRAAVPHPGEVSA